MSKLVPSAVFILCFLTSSACAFLLARNYLRTRSRFLMWCALCFGLLAMNNLVILIDALGLVDGNVSLVRASFSLAALAVLLFGFIWDVEE